MALYDRQTLLSDRQAVTATAFSVDQYDTGNIGSPGRNIGRAGTPLRVVFTCQQTATAAGAATVDFQIGHADDAAGTNFQILASTGPRALATLTNGATLFDVPIPDTTRRFVMARYVVATGPLTAGQFTCGLLNGSDHQRAYPSGHNPSLF